MLVKKWKPNYATIEEARSPAATISLDGDGTGSTQATVENGDIAEQKKKKKKKKKSHQLSTKGIIFRFRSIAS
jgi:hypothetical protein